LKRHHFKRWKGGQKLGEIFARHNPDEELRSKIYKELLTLNNQDKKEKDI
jgi:serine phosphatase RsbU (regulator of sigma subunit)